MLDLKVLEMAASDERVVITADKDLGELVFVHGIACPGVILIRIALAEEMDRVQRIRSTWPTIISRLPGSFITITTAGIRVRPIRP